MIKVRKSKKKPLPHPPARSTEPGIKRTSVYILGDTPIVAEYVTLCAARGYATFYNVNDTGIRASLSESDLIRKSAQIPSHTSFALELTNIDLKLKRKNLERLDEVLPASVAIASTSVTVSATEQSSWVKQKNRLVGCCALPTIGGNSLVEIAPTVFSPAETLQVVHRFFRSIGKEIELIQDRVGMVLPRILCQVINEAAMALEEEVALPQDIDTAMTLGACFPLGPIAWADKIGMEQVHAVLLALQRDFGGDRYRISPLLKQMAVSGTWWHRT